MVLYTNYKVGEVYLNNIFLTGEIQVGKTTLLNNIIKRLNYSVGGFQTCRNIYNDNGNIKREFFIKSLINNNHKYKIATITSFEDRFNVEPYTSAFETIANTIIRESIKKCDVIVLDELGFLESNAFDFQSSVFEALNSYKLTIGVIKPRSIPFLDKIRNRDDVHIFEVTKENRNKILNDILNVMKKYNFEVIKKD